MANANTYSRVVLRLQTQDLFIVKHGRGIVRNKLFNTIVNQITTRFKSKAKILGF
jgi:hypothetical protein